MAALFADIKTPYVNEATLKRVMSSRVKENIFQGIFTRPGEAVIEKYSEDTDGGWLITLQEQRAPKSAMFFFNTDATTTATAYEALKGA